MWPISSSACPTRLWPTTSEALKNAPNAPTSLYGRGVAKLLKGDTAGSTADFDAAKRSMPSIAEEFTKVGVQAKPKGFF